MSKREQNNLTQVILFSLKHQTACLFWYGVRNQTKFNALDPTKSKLTAKNDVLCQDFWLSPLLCVNAGKSDKFLTNSVGHYPTGRPANEVYILQSMESLKAPNPKDFASLDFLIIDSHYGSSSEENCPGHWWYVIIHT